MSARFAATLTSVIIGLAPGLTVHAQTSEDASNRNSISLTAKLLDSTETVIKKLSADAAAKKDYEAFMGDDSNVNQEPDAKVVNSKYPKLAAALKASGISPSDVVKVFCTLTVTGLVHAACFNEASTCDETSRANIALYKASGEKLDAVIDAYGPFADALSAADAAASPAPSSSSANSASASPAPAPSPLTEEKVDGAGKCMKAMTGDSAACAEWVALSRTSESRVGPKNSKYPKLAAIAKSSGIDPGEIMTVMLPLISAKSAAATGDMLGVDAGIGDEQAQANTAFYEANQDRCKAAFKALAALAKSPSSAASPSPGS